MAKKKGAVAGVSDRTDMEEQVVVFTLQREEFAVGISSVKEIIRVPEITAVPKAQSFVEGIINLRGKVIPVLSLKKLFNFQDTAGAKETKIVIIETGEFNMGFLVDGVTEVLKLQQQDIEPPPTSMAEGCRQYIRGIGKVKDRLLILLELRQILTAEDRQDLGLLVNR